MNAPPLLAPGSLRRRLLVAAALSIALALGLVGVMLVALFRQHVEGELADRAQGQLDTLIAALVVRPAPGPGAPPRVGVEREPVEPAFQRPFGGFYWWVSRADDGHALLRSRSWWDRAPDPRWTAETASAPDVQRATRLGAVGPAGQPLMQWARRVELAGLDGPLVVAVAADVTRVQATTRSFARTVTIALAALALALWAAAWLQVRSGLAPLRALHAWLGRVRAGEARRIPGRHPSEVQPLIDDLNAVLADNDALLERARQQAGNLAHGLQTPLAVLNNAAADWPGEEGELLRQQLERMRRQVEWQLLHARAAAGRQPALQATTATAVRPALDDLKRVLARVHAPRELTLDIDAEDSSLRVAVEPEPLKEMLGNLLDNACKWARQRVRVRVPGAALTAADAVVRIEIDDDGPGIAAHRRLEALQRGRRLDEQQPGSGLGLAIVDELARLHGGAVELTDSDLGGLRAVLSLPAR